jgi:aromatic ring-opening dioxygenase LigB subunit
LSALQCSFVPHPPIILEEIGGVHTREVEKTRESMFRLARETAVSAPDTIIISSPHAKGGIGNPSIYTEAELSGSFAEFGFPSLRYSCKNDLDLVAGLLESGARQFFDPLDEGRLDHGEMVFLDFLKSTGHNPRIIVISAVWGSTQLFYAAGQALGGFLREHGGKVQFIASGDLSHATRNTPGRRATKEGPEFDRIIAQAVGGNDPQPLLALKEDFIHRAQQCGLCSFLLGMGVMDGAQAKGEVYSYEDPFGVGYLVGKIAGGGE